MSRVILSSLREFRRIRGALNTNFVLVDSSFVPTGLNREFPR